MSYPTLLYVGAGGLATASGYPTVVAWACEGYKAPRFRRYPFQSAHLGALGFSILYVTVLHIVAAPFVLCH